MSKKILITILIISLAASSCRKKRPNLPNFWGYQIPHSLFFLIEQKEQRLPDSILNYLKLSYNLDKTKMYVSDFQRATGAGYDLGIMTTRDIGFLSSGKSRIKTYYLQYPDGSQDTLFVDYQYLTPVQADTSACYCLYPLRQVKFDNQPAPVDSAITVQRVYLFNKP